MVVVVADLLQRFKQLYRLWSLEIRSLWFPRLLARISEICSDFLGVRTTVSVVAVGNLQLRELSAFYCRF
jgi:hypothetical protein